MQSRNKHVWSALTSVISVAEEEKEKEVQPMMVQFDHRHHQHHHHLSIGTYMYHCNVAAHHLSFALPLSLSISKQNYTCKPTYPRLMPNSDALTHSLLPFGKATRSMMDRYLTPRLPTQNIPPKSQDHLSLEFNSLLSQSSTH